MDKFKTNEQTSQKIPKEVLDQIRRDGMPDFSSLGLYGNSAVFAKRLKEGYYSSAEFDKFIREYKLEIGPKTAMKELVEAWIK